MSIYNNLYCKEMVDLKVNYLEVFIERSRYLPKLSRRWPKNEEIIKLHFPKLRWAICWFFSVRSLHHLVRLQCDLDTHTRTFVRPMCAYRCVQIHQHICTQQKAVRFSAMIKFEKVDVENINHLLSFKRSMDLVLKLMLKITLY